LNKPVVVSEEVLGAPVLVPDLTADSPARAAGPAYIVLAGISFSHFLNDTMQSLIASVYPILKDNYALDFAQIGMITLAFQFTASLLQPVVGHFTDKKAQPFSLAIGMGFTFFGLLLLSIAHHYGIILIAAALVGLGSAVFSYLWLKSGYVPGALAVLGVFGSLLLAASTFAFIIFPDLTRILAPWYMAPIGIFEVTMGGWLLLRRLRPSGTAQPVQTGG